MVNKINLVALAKECPGITITIKAEDLVNANALLIEQAKRELEESIARRDAVTYLTREQVMQKLNITGPTLWRWGKRGYLVPINIGGNRRYKSTDIDEILEGKR